MKNKSFQTTITLALLALATLNSQLSTAFAQGTAFTYEGQLYDGTGPANSIYDLRFAIFDAASAGNRVLEPLTNSAVAISNGLFTVTLDFGAGAFDGTPRWLEIGVRTNANDDFTILSPRQPFTASPYAIFAGTAATVAGGSVVTSLNGLKDDVTLAAGNNVTLTPDGNVLTIDAANGGGSSIWSQLNNNAYYNLGNVGIGTSTPAHRLSLAGGPNWTANLWKGALDLEFGAAMGFRGDPGTEFGIGSASGGLYFFHTASSPGTTGSPSVFDMELSDSGHLLLGGPNSDRAGIPLQVKGNVLFSSGGSGGEVQFMTPGGETGMSIIGTNRADVRFDGSTLKLLAGFGPGAMPSQNGITINTSGNVGIGTAIPGAKLDVETSSGRAITAVTSSSSDAIYGFNSGTSGKGVHGYDPFGTGVYGESGDSSGIGVMAYNPGNVALYANGNAEQTRNNGGFVKAMALIHVQRTTLPYTDTASVVRCYNGIANTSSGNCSFNVSADRASATVDFGFTINDRFILVTGFGGDVTSINNFPTSTSVTILCGFDDTTDFYIYVF